MNKKSIFLFVLFALFFVSCNKNKTSIGRSVEVLYSQYNEEDYVGRHFPSQLEEAFEKDLNLNKLKNDAAEMMKFYSKQQLFHEYLGILLMDKGFYQNALIHFEEAIKLRPKSANLYFYYGVCAGQLYQAFIVKEDRSAINDKAEYYLNLAEKAYLKTVELKASYHEALYALGIIYYYEKKDNQSAVAVMSLATSLVEDDFKYRRLLAYAYYSADEYALAIKEGLKAKSLAKTKEEKDQIRNFLNILEVK